MGSQHIASELSRVLHMPELVLDDNGACAIGFEPGLRVDLHFMERESVVRLLAPLGRLEPGELDDALAAGLMANLEVAARMSGQIAYEPARRWLLLCAHVPLQTASGTSLAAQLPALLDQVRNVRSLLGPQLAPLD